MIDIGGKLVNPARIVSAEIDNRFYMNGSATFLIVKLDTGEIISREHGFGFDVYKTLEQIKRG